jgi:hypothetical protein
MKMIEPGNCWEKRLSCEGGVHTNFGCGAVLEVKLTDLFYLHGPDNRDTVAFQCPCCGLGTIVSKKGDQEWSRWFHHLYKTNPCRDDRRLLELQQYEKLEELVKYVKSLVARYKRLSRQKAPSKKPRPRSSPIAPR